MNFVSIEMITEGAGGRWEVGGRFAFLSGETVRGCRVVVAAVVVAAAVVVVVVVVVVVIVVVVVVVVVSCRVVTSSRRASSSEANFVTDALQLFHAVICPKRGV